MVKYLKIESVKIRNKLNSNKNSIYFKIIVLILTTIVIQTLFNTSIANYTTYNTMNDLFKDNLYTLTVKEKDYFDTITSNVENLTMALVTDEEFLDYGSKIDFIKGLEKVNGLKVIKETLSKAINSNKFIANIYIISDKGQIISPNAIGEMNIMTQEKYKWYEEIMENNRNDWFVIDDDSFPITRLDGGVAFGIKLNPPIGNPFIILYDLKKDTFLSSFESMKVGDTSKSYIILPSQDVIYGEQEIAEDQQKLKSEKGLVNAFLSKLGEKKETTFYYEQEKLLVSCIKSEETDWIYINTVDKDEIFAPAKEVSSRLIFSSFLSGVIFILIGIFFSIKIISPIKLLMNVIKKAEYGDFTVKAKIKSTDEIGGLASAFNSMIEQIKELIIKNQKLSNTVNVLAEQIDDISKENTGIINEVANSIEEVAKGAREQSLQVEEGNKSVYILSKQIEHMNQDIQSIDKISSDVQTITVKGLAIMEELQKNSLKTTQSSKQVVVSMESLSNSIKEIIKITEMLNKISDQTKLLSLNASIEAARSGQYGKGFAVVAEKIRELAEESTIFTKNIESIIQNIILQSKESTEIVHEYEKVVLDQKETINKSIESFENIRNITNEFINYTKNISQAIKNTDGYKKHVLINMEHISTVSEMTASATEEISASTQEQLTSIEELSNMAGQLSQLSRDLINSMDKFRI